MVVPAVIESVVDQGVGLTLCVASAGRLQTALSRQPLLQSSRRIFQIVVGILDRTHLSLAVTERLRDFPFQVSQSSRMLLMIHDQGKKANAEMASAPRTSIVVRQLMCVSIACDKASRVRAKTSWS
jgi:hypothetical protein